MDQLFPEPSTFGQCDCTSYSYFALSVVLFAVGTFFTVVALWDEDGSSWGQIWVLGLIFVCLGLMALMRTAVYLRRKGVLQMLLRQRALVRVRVHFFLHIVLSLLVFNF